MDREGEGGEEGREGSGEGDWLGVWGLPFVGSLGSILCVKDCLLNAVGSTGLPVAGELLRWWWAWEEEAKAGPQESSNLIHRRPPSSRLCPFMTEFPTPAWTRVCGPFVTMVTTEP